MQDKIEAAGTAPRLPLREKIGYSFGDAASNLYFYTFILFLPIFYTDVFGLPAAAMGTMFLVTRIWDAVNDPIMGIIADRTHTRWGKFRPYILGLAVPLAIGGVLTFTTPDFGGTGKLVYAYITYTLMMMLYTAVNVPYSALMGVITPNSLERTGVSTFRFVAAFVGQIIIGASALLLVARLGGGNEAAGWQRAMAIYGVLAVLLLAATFALTRERVQPTREQNNKVREDLKDLLKNLPWLLIAAATFFQLAYIVIRGSSTAYYFRYYVGNQELEIFGKIIPLGFEVFTSSFVTLGTISTVTGALMTKWFARRFDKKNTYAGFLLGSAVISALFYFLQPQHVLAIYGLNIIVCFFFGSVAVLQWAIYADTADYGEWKTGRRATGLVMAASLFALKLGLTLGGAFVGWILAYHGFVSQAGQSEETITGIRLLMSIYPAAFGIIGGLIMLFYPLTNRTMVDIENDLHQRRG